SVLEAIATGLRGMLRPLFETDANEDNKKGFSENDLHQDFKSLNENIKLTDLVSQSISRAPYGCVKLTAETANGKKISWNTAGRRPGVADKELPKGIRDAHELAEYLDVIFPQIGENKKVYLPVAAYYGTERAVPEKVRTGELQDYLSQDFGRFKALDGALSARQHFALMVQWFAFQEDMERRERQERKDFGYIHPVLEGMRKAICDMIPHSSNPRILPHPLELVVTLEFEDGRRELLRLRQLSDGYRTMLALVMDLARRMAQANPYLGAEACSAPAIVLIDEIDLHLHPGWQQTVLQNLMRAFPGAQFIVTTHSPQVLSTVHRENIWLLERCEERGICVFPPVTESYGAESAKSLHSLMHVDPRPQNLPEVVEYNHYMRLVNHGRHDTEEARQLREKLEKVMDASELNLADMLIRKHKALNL
ncbi:MAG: AAA family ATPase, partial [Gammaproteobacteria bacterium]|nr:AAA family ATPase [Gammaproteobacteria bacterium]